MIKRALSIIPDLSGLPADSLNVFRAPSFYGGRNIPVKDMKIQVIHTLSFVEDFDRRLRNIKSDG